MGSIGGMPTFNTKLFNTVFLIIVLLLLVFSFIVREERLHLILSDVAIFAVSLKIMLLMHNEARVNHFELWVLTSIEWRVNEISKEIKKLKKENDEK